MSQMGDKATCDQCGEVIEYVGPYWRHTASEPRHVAFPVRPPAHVRIRTPEGLKEFNEDIRRAMKELGMGRDPEERVSVLVCMTVAEGIVETGSEPRRPHSLLPAPAHYQAEIVREIVPSWFQPMPIVAMYNPDGVDA